MSKLFTASWVAVGYKTDVGRGGVTNGGATGDRACCLKGDVSDGVQIEAFGFCLDITIRSLIDLTEPGENLDCVRASLAPGKSGTSSSELYTSSPNSRSSSPNVFIELLTGLPKNPGYS